MKLIEAVPNISEGKNKAVIDALADCLGTGQDVKLLGTDTNPAANRTVFTLIGEPVAVCRALFDFIKLAGELIDMRTQHGAHPRLGAVDVCPLVPLKNISLEQTAHFARQLGQRVGTELQIPVYLYEAAAASMPIMSTTTKSSIRVKPLFPPHIMFFIIWVLLLINFLFTK